MYVLYSLTCLSFSQFLSYKLHNKYMPSGQNLADSVGNPRGLWWLVEGIHGEIWVVSETRIHMEIQGKFLIQG